MNMRSDYVIKGSILSEKSYGLLESKVYTLKVDLKATKADIKAAVKDVFGVDVVDVNTSILRGRVVRKARSKKSGAVEVKLPNIKKAFIRLKDGQELPAPVVAAPADAAAE
ncbi:50S ribosomal protein L23 [Fluviispira vulneris]|uniref:50S ribosomal protein L23 n=1 Tax=Fluviispira vulneris TaxID=2763012 RepID=UPI001644FE20|nr:50S ribosomal protein L23 [Fluviispira vulneris]